MELQQPFRCLKLHEVAKTAFKKGRGQRISEVGNRNPAETNRFFGMERGAIPGERDS